MLRTSQYKVICSWQCLDFTFAQAGVLVQNPSSPGAVEAELSCPGVYGQEFIIRAARQQASSHPPTNLPGLGLPVQTVQAGGSSLEHEQGQGGA